jgi:hypothetical protein
MGVVRLDDEGRFVVTSDFRNAFEVVSIEAKLTRWKTALEQAKTYFRFSDRAFVALPSSVVARNPLIREQCRQNGVGLIAVTPSSVDVVIDAASTGLSDHREWTWLLAKTGAFHI